MELRLYDEKRKQLKIGDTIRFYCLPEEKEWIETEIIGLIHYPSFEKLFDIIDYNLSGPTESKQKKLEGIHTIYTPEQEKENGVLGIHISLLTN